MSDQTGPATGIAVIFDLDGVLVTTDELHYSAWKSVADEIGVEFTRETNHLLRGVSRMDSLEIILRGSSGRFGPEEKEAMATRKNDRFRAALERLDASAILPGAVDLLDGLDALGVAYAVASSSRNARRILERTGLARRMRVVVDGNDIRRSKPDPEVFLLAAAGLGVAPGVCVVVEDAESGVEAARAAGMAVLGVGEADRLAGSDRVVGSLAEIGASEVVGLARGAGSPG